MSFARLRATDTPTHMHIHRSARVYTHTYTQTRARTHTQARVYIHTYTHKRTCTHTHTHLPNPLPSGEKQTRTHTHKTFCDCNVHHRPSHHGCRWSYMYQRWQHNSVHTLTTERLPVPKETERKKNGESPSNCRRYKPASGVFATRYGSFFLRGHWVLTQIGGRGGVGGMWGGVGRGVCWRRRRRKTALILYHSVPVRVSHIARRRIQLTPRDPTYSKATYNFVQTSLKATGLEHTS